MFFSENDHHVLKFIELDDGKILTGNPYFYGKKPWIFPSTNPLKHVFSTFPNTILRCSYPANNDPMTRMITQTAWWFGTFGLFSII